MILFFNVFVTNNRGSAGSTNRYDRLDLFKHSLASYAKIDRLTRVVIYAELDGDYKNRAEELVNHLAETFPGLPVDFYDHSPHNQEQWQKALVESQLLETGDPILYMGNDDHVFVDQDTEVLYEGLDLMAAEPPDQINTLHISSWPEAVSTVFGLREFKRVGRWWESPMLYPDACQVVNAAFFRHVFFDLEIGSEFIRRTDPFLTNWYPFLGDFKWQSKLPHPKVKTWIPLREQVRHFDAYYHVNVPLERCPLLEIPQPTMTTEEYNAAHRQLIVTPHQRDYQRPTLVTPAMFPQHYSPTPNDQELPLDDETISAGCR